MPNFALPRTALERISADPQHSPNNPTETHSPTCEKCSLAARIAHTATSPLKGKLLIEGHLPSELAQGLFAQPAAYDVVVHLNIGDAETTTLPGLAIKLVDAEGITLTPFQGIGPDTGNLDFHGHKNHHPLDDDYYSQLFRFGAYVARFGIVPSSPGLLAIKQCLSEGFTHDALHEATIAFFHSNPAEFEFKVQLHTDLETMDLADGAARWPEEQYRTVARLVIQAQNADDLATESIIDTLPLAPARAPRLIGPVNRARRAASSAMATLRGRGNKPSGTTLAPA